MRGLKQRNTQVIRKQAEVASFTDAWIETQRRMVHCQMKIVASFTDAWIETQNHKSERLGIGSHLLQMRGLKLTVNMKGSNKEQSHLLQMRGLKLINNVEASLESSRIFYRCVD